jgi:hypothetical protein
MTTESNQDPLASAIVRSEQGGSLQLDISHLSDEQKAQLALEYQQGMIDLDKRAKSLDIEVGVLGDTLNRLADTTEQVTNQEGSHITITHTQDSSVGHTEIIMGNTEQSRRGRLSRSATGDFDVQPILVIGGIIVAIIVVIAVIANAL